MAILGRELLASSQAHLARREVTIEGLDGAVMVRELTDGEASKAQKLAIAAVRDGQVVEPERLTQMRALMVRSGWIDASGANILAQGEEGEIDALPRRLVDAMAEAIAELSGLQDAAAASAGRQRAEKNLQKTRNGGSVSS